MSWCLGTILRRQWILQPFITQQVQPLTFWLYSMKPMMGRNHDSMGASISWVVKSIHCSTCPCMPSNHIPGKLIATLIPCHVDQTASVSLEGTQARLDHTASKEVAPKRPLSAILDTYLAMALLSKTPPWGVSSVGTWAAPDTSRGCSWISDVGVAWQLHRGVVGA